MATSSGEISPSEPEVLTSTEAALLLSADTDVELSSSLNVMVKGTCWDPMRSKDWDNEKSSSQCINRVKRDLANIFKEPPPGMCVIPDKNDMTIVHALITGPFDTPYEGGFFYFIIRCPPDYPIRPPRVKLVTTDGERVRFNPNLYKSGKVCLSILGTWTGPAWSPAQSLSSVLLSIQSLMNDKPYHNEPGFEKERNIGDAARYNEIIQHETLRVAVVGNLENPHSSCPPELREVMEQSFSDYYDYYVTTCKGCAHLDKQSMQDPFGGCRGVFNYSSLVSRLEKLKEKFAVTEDTLESSMSELEDENDDDKPTKT